MLWWHINGQNARFAAIYAACGPFPNYSTLAEEVFALSD
jgi:hypothetical protein